MNEKIKNELSEEGKAKREAFLAAIAAELPPIVFRNWPKWRHVLPMAPRTVANDDAIKKGPKEKVFIGRNAGYPKAAFLDYLNPSSWFKK